jgi:predicted dithiol-disulfide oxidoreductase (DUF899 family)
MTQAIVDQTAWAKARAALLEEEKALTESLDRVASLRRKMPWQQVTAEYAFVTPAGRASLANLFDGRRQLIIYHHMLRAGDLHPCSGCGMLADQLPHPAHLHARDTTLVLVSKAPLAEIEAFRHRMGQEVLPWVETTDAFSADHGMGEHGPGFTVFIRDGDAIYHSYATTGRGTEAATTVWGLLDMTPMGRQENWQDAPAWVPQGRPYEWWELHDEYPSRA